MKLLGAVLVITSAFAFGSRLIFSRRQNIAELKRAVSFLTQIKTTLGFSLKSPEELFEDAVREEAFFIRDKTTELCKKGKSFVSAYREAVATDENLESKDRLKLLVLAEILGLFDRETQEERIKLLIYDIKKSAEEKETELINKERLYMLISLSLGTGIVIILV